MAAIPVYFFFAQTLMLVPGSLSFLITNSKRYHSCICRGLEHVLGHNLTMQIKVEILYYPKMWLLYCTNKIIIFSALGLFRARKCPHNAIPRAKVPSRCNSARESALFPQAAPCPFSILGRTLCVYGITLWNALRIEIKSKNSVNAFKKVTKNT